MTASDEFKAQLKAGKIQNALKLAINQAIELKITTWISTSDLETGDPIPPTKSNSYLRSRLNIVDGKIDNEVSHQLLNHPLYSELQQLHLAQVVQGSQTIYNNLDSLQKLVELLNKLPNQTQENSSQVPGDLVEESQENILNLEAYSQSETDELSVIPIISEVQTQVIGINTNAESKFIDSQNLPQDTLSSEKTLNIVVEYEEQQELQENYFQSSITEELEVLEEDDDWGDLIEEDSINYEPNLVNSAKAEDWNDWEIEQPEPEVTITPIESLDFEEEEDWMEEEDGEETENKTPNNQEPPN